jgi:putative transposase
VIRAREPLPLQLMHDSRLVRTRLGEFYLCIPTHNTADARATPVMVPDAMGDESQIPSSAAQQQERMASAKQQLRVCSMDPGVRTFQMLFDTSGMMIEVGSGDLQRLYRLCKAADELQSRCDAKQPTDQTRFVLASRKRYRLRRARLRIYEKIRRLVKEVHCKLVSFLVRSYDVVLLPTFESSRMAVRKGRKLNSRTARGMLTWSHYSFKQRLLSKARALGDRCKVVIVDESFTSKTCTRCGWVHQKLGGNKVFKCQRCALVINRDYNGARNILLKNASNFALRVHHTTTTSHQSKHWWR